MKKFFKSKISIIILLLLFPIIFILIFKFCIKYLPGEMIGSIDGWLGFLGGYFGVLGALGAIWWQKEIENKIAINNMNIYTNYIVETLANKLEKNYMQLLTTFSTLDGHDDLYEIQEIDIIKKDFNIINTDTVNSNLSIILSNEKFIILLELKEKLDNLNYYIIKLENHITKGNLYTSLLDNIDKVLEKDKNNKECFRKLIEELTSLRSILLYLNTNLLNTPIEIEESIIPEYKIFIQDIRKAFKSKNNLDILKCYENCISNIVRTIILINEKLSVKIFHHYIYTYNLLNLINTIKTIYEDIEKLKSIK